MNSKYVVPPKTKMAAKSIVSKQSVLCPRQKVHPSRVSKPPVAPQKVKCVSIGKGQCAMCIISDLRGSSMGIVL